MSTKQRKASKPVDDVIGGISSSEAFRVDREARFVALVEETHFGGRRQHDRKGRLLEPWAMDYAVVMDAELKKLYEAAMNARLGFECALENKYGLTVFDESDDLIEPPGSSEQGHRRA